PGIELVGDPAGEARFCERRENRLHVEIAAVDRRESEGLTLPTLQMDVADAVPELADLLSGLSAGRGQMRGVGTEIDRRVAKDLPNILRPFHDRGQVRMVMRREPSLAGDIDDLVQRCAEPLEVVSLAATCAFGAAADNQMLRLKLGCRRGRSLDARQL